jgi:hypothetical protein
MRAKTYAVLLTEEDLFTLVRGLLLLSKEEQHQLALQDVPLQVRYDVQHKTQCFIDRLNEIRIDLLGLVRKDA